MADGVRKPSSRPVTSSASSRLDSSRGRLLLAAGLGVLAVVFYLPVVLRGGLIWDDRIWSRAPAVLEWSGLRDIWFAPSLIEGEGHYWPLTYTTLWLEHKIWGLAPAGHHAVNVALHLANTLVLWRILRRLAVPGALAAAAVFAAHPLHVESVAWIIERKDVLSALFYLGAARLWLQFLERPRWSAYGLALALFLAGLLSKSVVVTLPAALLVIQWWKHGRIAGHDLLRLAPFFVVALLVTAGDLAFYRSREALEPLDYSLVERVLIASRALWFYAGKLVWPTDLAVVYPLWDIRLDDPVAWLYLAAASALAAALWFLRDRIGRGPLAGAAYFAVTLSPTLGFVDFSYMQFSLVADRFQYLAGIGLMAVAAGAASVSVARLSQRWGRRRVHPAAGLALGIVLLLLGTQTWRQSEIYRDELVFNRHIIAHNPVARDAHRNLAAELFRLERFEEALRHARLAVRQYPDCGPCRAGLGAVLVRLEQLDEAETHVRRALEIEPRNRSALQNASELFRLRGRHEEGVAAARIWLELRPDASAPHQALARLFADMNRLAEAEGHWRRAHEIDPRDVVVIQNLAETIRKQGRLEESLGWYREILPIRPDFALAHAAMGHVLFDLGRHDLAIDALTRAVELAPDLPGAPSLLVKAAQAQTRLGRHTRAARTYARIVETAPGFAHALFRRGVELAQQGRHDQALETFRTVAKLLPDNPAVHSNLGAVLHHLGRTGEALKSIDRALSIDPTFGDALDNRRALTRGKRP